MAKKKKKPWDDTWQAVRSLKGGGQGKTRVVKRRSNGDEEYVLKELIKQDDPERRQRMHREVQALRQLQHTRLPKIIESNTDEFAEKEVPLYFVMEYVEGQTLEERVSQGPLQPEEAIRLLIQITDILIHCHQNGFIHRDIKPDNIILRGANILDPVVIDFGLSFNKEDTDRSPLTPEWQQLGNRFLHLPELQTDDSSKRHPESDISQVCGLLFFTLTGKVPGHLVNHEGLKPHQRDSAKPILDEIGSPSLISLFDKGFEQVFDKRFRSFEAFKGRLHEVLDEFVHSQVSINQGAGTVTLETITPEIRTALTQRPREESNQDELAKAKETDSNVNRDDYFKGDNADALMYATFLGEWNERSEGDQEVIRELIEGND